MPEHYQIRVKGHLDLTWSEWFDGLCMTHEPNGDTLLSGSLPDQAALYGMLEKAQMLNLHLVSVTQSPPPSSM